MNYPFVSQWVNQRNQSKVIYEYEKKAEKLSDTGKQKLLGEARNYNSKLRAGRVLRVTVLEVAQKKLLHTENIRNFWMSPETGSCVIWKFRRSRSFCRFFMELRSMFWNRGRDICLVLHFLSGERGTHAVIAAHTGIATRMFFTDLDQMKTGDLFFLNVLGEKLAYQVDQIVTVTPDRTDLLRIEEGKDQVTLVTCTPYGINSHRLLVRGKRIPYREAQKRAEQAKESGFLIWGKRVFVLSILFSGSSRILAP